jgi:hypothetical protein
MQWVIEAMTATVPDSNQFQLWYAALRERDVMSQSARARLCSCARLQSALLNTAHVVSQMVSSEKLRPNCFSDKLVHIAVVSVNGLAAFSAAAFTRLLQQ